MSKINIDSCQPFRAWNRLEPRTRDNEFDKELECGVHDALWMLTRQWQMGELQGEDAGSAIFAKIKMRTAPVTKVKNANAAVTPFNDNAPLEKWVESMPVANDLHTAMETGHIFLQSLEKAAAWLGVTDFNRNTYRRRLTELCPVADLPAITATDTDADILRKADALANTDRVQLTRAASRRYFSGVEVYRQILTNQVNFRNQLLTINAAHASLVQTAITEYSGWYAANFSQHAGSGNAWVPSQLEYQFACCLPQANGTHTVLSARQYTGELDWFSFDVENDPAITTQFGTPAAQDMAQVKDELLTVIPVEANFAGAPHSRWWQFENGKVDLGNITAEKTDIAKMVTTEYALLYGNNWLQVPLTVPVGTLCEIRGIVVRDVFGEQTFIASALQGQTDDWSAWGMYNLSTHNTTGRRDQPVDIRSFIPPATVKTLESDAIEEVRFIRDEMSNHVWAIETKIPDGMGGSEDGHQLSTRYRELLGQYEVPAPADNENLVAALKYELGNNVPENWIPFLPVKRTGSARAIQLQRASMPRLFRNNYTRVRPRTPLLRFNVNANNEQQSPYFINEEEVPRAGVQVQAGWQRTRWYNGTVFNWYGISKTAGRGEGSSGLKYDTIAPVK
jgi:hypothetical protein